MKTKPPLEKEVQAQCLQYLAARGIFAWRVNSGAVAGEHKGKKRFVRFQSIRGVSDIIGVLPPGGRMFACEVKRPGGKPSIDQELFLGDVRQAGGLAVVVHSVDELIEALQAAMGGKP